MHKIGIISDTHGLLRPEVVKALEDCEVILHGGDINNKAILDKLNGIAPVYVVRGNNDKEWAQDLPETVSVELFGLRFFMIHNKKYIPKDLDNIDVIVYGHSHKYEEKYEREMLLINPGSCGPRRFIQPITLAVLEVEDDCSYRARKIEIAHVQSGAGRERGSGNSAEGRMKGRDMKRIIKAVMRDTDKGIPVSDIALRNDIKEDLAELICRLYLTHPGVSADGIMGKMGL